MLGKQGQAARWERTMLKLGSWPLNTVNVWPELTRAYRSVEVLKFYGGEPLMLEQHSELLDSLVASGQATNVELHYSTNGTIYSDAYAQAWKHFRRVGISLSIDDIGNRFEYQRKNAVWPEVVENLYKFKQLADTNKNIVLSVNITVSVFNVLYLEELVMWLKENFNVPFKLIMLNVVEYYSISRLSPANKLAVEQRLAGKFESVVRYMNQGQGTAEDQEKLVRAITQFDEYREERLAASHPELANLLNCPDI
jgi:MoaA/NifB/PqqE/SkfB family radical SAM enzyme